MRLTKQIDLEELGYDYVLLDETKQPSANYKLGEYEDIDTDPAHLARTKQALEVIKEKQVNISALLEFDNLQQYNDYCDTVGGCKRLTEEEYELLKEVLL